MNQQTTESFYRRGARAAWDRNPAEPPRGYTPDQRVWWLEGWFAGKDERDVEDAPTEPDSSRTVEWRNGR